MSKDSPFNIGLTGVEGRILFYQLCYLIISIFSIQFTDYHVIFICIIQDITPEGRELRESGVISRSDYAKRQEMRVGWHNCPLGLRQKAGNEGEMA